MNPRLDLLHTYPFEKLARLKAGVEPPKDLPHIAMSIGEPQHEPPSWQHLNTFRSNAQIEGGLVCDPVPEG